MFSLWAVQSANQKKHQGEPSDAKERASTEGKIETMSA
jgi:hypothetical protein